MNSIPRQPGRVTEAAEPLYTDVVHSKSHEPVKQASRRVPGRVIDAFHPASKQPQQIRSFVFLGMAHQDLQSHTNPEKGLVPCRIQDRSVQMMLADCRHAITRGSLPRKNHPICILNESMVISDTHLCIGGHMLYGLGNRTKVPHPVVDNSDLLRHVDILKALLKEQQKNDRQIHKLPLVEGMTSRIRSSNSNAMRKARPKALNMVSA